MTSITPPPPTPDLDAMQRSVRAKLAKLGSRVRAQIALDALVRCVAVVLGLLALSLLLDYWLELSRPMRVIYWLVTLAGGAHFVYHYGIKPLGRALGPIELAEAVDVAKGHEGDVQLAPRVATVLQLPKMAGDEASISNQMIRDAVGRSYDSIEQRSFDGIIDRGHIMQCLGVLLASIVLPGILAGAMTFAGDNVLGTWAQRWLMFGDSPYPRNTIIEVVGLDNGVLTIPAGENVTLYTRITTKDGKPVDEARVSLTPKGAKSQALALTRFDDSDFRLDMDPLSEIASATVAAGDQTLRFDVVPSPRPRLTGITLTHTHPADPQNPKTIDFDGAEGEVALLELNEVELKLTANVAIAEVTYAADEFAEEADAQLPPIERLSDNTFVIRWTHQARQRLRVELKSKQAGLVSQPIPISVGLKTDRKPSARLRSSGVGQRITPNAMIPLDLEARDDYGLTNMGLDFVRVRVGEDGGEKAFETKLLYEDPKASSKTTSTKLGLEIEEYGVRPTDVIRLSGIATDARYVGAQRGESTQLTFRIVTHKELFREIIARQQQARSSFRQAIEDSRDVQAALTEAKTGAQAQAQARRFRAIQRSVWKVGRELERSAEEMRLNRLGGSREDGNQAYESMKATILDPLGKLHDQTMSVQRDALEAAGSADPEQLKRLAKNQQQVVNEMTDLLKRMARWDDFLDTINQLTEVIDQQQRLKKTLEELEEEKNENLFDD